MNCYLDKMCLNGIDDILLVKSGDFALLTIDNGGAQRCSALPSDDFPSDPYDSGRLKFIKGDPPFNYIGNDGQHILNGTVMQTVECLGEHFQLIQSVDKKSVDLFYFGYDRQCFLLQFREEGVYRYTPAFDTPWARDNHGRIQILRA